MTTLAAVIGRDVLANRPAAGVEGRLFEATDTTPPTVYRDNGASWDTYATAGAATVTTTRGDLIVRGVSADGPLAIGAANRLLRSDGTDPSWGQVVEGDLNLADVTTGDVGITKHGLAPKAPNDATKFLDGTGAWSTPAGGGGGGGGFTRTAIGTTSTGGSQQTLNTNVWYCKKITLPADGLLASIVAILKQTGDHVWSVGAALWTDSGGSPNESIGAHMYDQSYNWGPSSGNYRAFRFPIGAWLAAGDYWIGVARNASSGDDIALAYAPGSGADKTLAPTGSWLQDAVASTIAGTSNDFSIYADVISSAGATPGGAWPPLYDHAAKRRCAAYGSGAYTNTTSASDGDPTTSADATTGAMPQDLQFDLSDNPPSIGSAHVVFRDSGHRSATGSLDSSTDGATWTSAVTWPGDATTDRWHVFSPVVARYWRIHTTAPGAGGDGIDVSTFSLYSSGRDRAQGIVPTCSGSVAAVNLANATDANVNTKATATSGGTYPGWYRVDLGAAYDIVGAHILFGDEGHCASNGALEYSTDDATWTAALAWTNEVAVERFLPLVALITARYWRIRADAVPGNSGMDLAQFELATAT